MRARELSHKSNQLPPDVVNFLTATEGNENLAWAFTEQSYRELAQFVGLELRDTELAQLRQSPDQRTDLEKKFRGELRAKSIHLDSNETKTLNDWVESREGQNILTDVAQA